MDGWVGGLHKAVSTPWRGLCHALQFVYGMHTLNNIFMLQILYLVIAGLVIWGCHCLACTYSLGPQYTIQNYNIIHYTSIHIYLQVPLLDIYFRYNKIAPYTAAYTFN